MSREGQSIYYIPRGWKLADFDAAENGFINYVSPGCTRKDLSDFFNFTNSENEKFLKSLLSSGSESFTPMGPVWYLFR